MKKNKNISSPVSAHVGGTILLSRDEAHLEYKDSRAAYDVLKGSYERSDSGFTEPQLVDLGRPLEFYWPAEDDHRASDGTPKSLVGMMSTIFPTRSDGEGNEELLYNVLFQDDTKNKSAALTGSGHKRKNRATRFDLGMMHGIVESLAVGQESIRNPNIREVPFYGDLGLTVELLDRDHLYTFSESVLVSDWNGDTNHKRSNFIWDVDDRGLLDPERRGLLSDQWLVRFNENDKPSVSINMAQILGDDSIGHGFMTANKKQGYLSGTRSGPIHVLRNPLKHVHGTGRDGLVNPAYIKLGPRGSLFHADNMRAAPLAFSNDPWKGSRGITRKIVDIMYDADSTHVFNTTDGPITTQGMMRLAAWSGETQPFPGPKPKVEPPVDSPAHAITGGGKGIKGDRGRHGEDGKNGKIIVIKGGKGARGPQGAQGKPGPAATPNEKQQPSITHTATPPTHAQPKSAHETPQDKCAEPRIPSGIVVGGNKKKSKTITQAERSRRHREQQSALETEAAASMVFDYVMDASGDNVNIVKGAAGVTPLTSNDARSCSSKANKGYSVGHGNKPDPYGNLVEAAMGLFRAHRGSSPPKLSGMLLPGREDADRRKERIARREKIKTFHQQPWVKRTNSTKRKDGDKPPATTLERVRARKEKRNRERDKKRKEKAALRQKEKDARNVRKEKRKKDREGAREARKKAKAEGKLPKGSFIDSDGNRWDHIEGLGWVITSTRKPKKGTQAYVDHLRRIQENADWYRARELDKEIEESEALLRAANMEMGGFPVGFDESPIETTMGISYSDLPPSSRIDNSVWYDRFDTAQTQESLRNSLTAPNGPHIQVVAKYDEATHSWIADGLEDAYVDVTGSNPNKGKPTSTVAHTFLPPQLDLGMTDLAPAYSTVSTWSVGVHRTGSFEIGIPDYDYGQLVDGVRFTMPEGTDELDLCFINSSNVDTGAGLFKVKGDQTIVGNTKLQADVTLGSIGAHKIDFKGSTVGHINPVTDAINDLGEATHRYRNVYASGFISGDTCWPTSASGVATAWFDGDTNTGLGGATGSGEFELISDGTVVATVAQTKLTVGPNLQVDGNVGIGVAPSTVNALKVQYNVPDVATTFLGLDFAINQTNAKDTPTIAGARFIGTVNNSGATYDNFNGSSFSSITTDCAALGAGTVQRGGQFITEFNAAQTLPVMLGVDVLSTVVGAGATATFVAGMHIRKPVATGTITNNGGAGWALAFGGDMGLEGGKIKFTGNNSPYVDTLYDLELFRNGVSNLKLGDNSGGHATMELDKMRFENGSAANPSVAPRTAPLTGFYNFTGQSIGFASNGVFALRFTASGMRVINGSAAEVSYGFSSESGNNTGMYKIAEDTLGLAAGGIEAVRITETANDVDIQIGTNGADTVSLDASVDSTIRFNSSLASFLIQPLNDTSGVGGVFTICGQQGATTSNGGKVILCGGDGGVTSGVGGELELRGGETLSSSSGGLVDIRGGTSLNGAGGNVAIDGGTGGGGVGDLLLGATQGTVNLGRLGMTTSVTGGLSVAEATVLSGDVDLGNANTDLISIAGAIDTDVRFLASSASFLVQPLDYASGTAKQFDIKGQKASVSGVGGVLAFTGGETSAIGPPGGALDLSGGPQTNGISGTGGPVNIDGGTGPSGDGTVNIAVTRGGLTLGRAGMTTNVDGTLIIDEDATIGTADTDTLTLNSKIAGDLIPSASGSSVGTDTDPWVQVTSDVVTVKGNAQGSLQLDKSTVGASTLYKQESVKGRAFATSSIATFGSLLYVMSADSFVEVEVTIVGIETADRTKTYRGTFKTGYYKSGGGNATNDGANTAVSVADNLTNGVTVGFSNSGSTIVADITTTSTVAINWTVVGKVVVTK